MSKSNRKNPDRLKDSCRHDRLRSERHLINQLIKEGRFEEIEEIDVEVICKEDNNKD